MKIAKKKFVSYIRVSTKKQEDSGLGLEAQQDSVNQFIGDGELVREFREIETGTSKRHRPILQQAIRFAKSVGATLVIAKLDRLARNVHFISGLLETRVDFVAVDNPNANTLTIQILAAVAEDEARRISERTKAAMAVAKKNGRLFGSRDPSIKRRSLACRSFIAANKASVEARRKLAGEHYADIIPTAVQMREQGMEYKDIAESLNEDGYRTRRGNEFTAHSIYSALQRAGKIQKVQSEVGSN